MRDGLKGGAGQGATDLVRNNVISFSTDHTPTTNTHTSTRHLLAIVSVNTRTITSSMLRARSDSQELFSRLSPTFNNASRNEWGDVADRFQKWVVGNEGHAEWDLGLELFWIAYVGAYPRFPSGEWPVWDVRIPMNGTFINRWMTMSLRDRATTNVSK